jgi:hypothetical protein
VPSASCSVVQQALVEGEINSRHVSGLGRLLPCVLGVYAGNFEKQSETVSVNLMFI